MAEKIVSPGVFTNERNLSFLPAGVAAIGAAIVGPTSKGRAFVPTVVNGWEDYKRQYGDLSDDTYVPYAVQSYLKSAGAVTVVRVVQEGGYSTSAIHIIHTTGSVARLVGVITPTTQVGSSTGKDYVTSNFTAFTGGSATGSFGFMLSGSGVTAQYLTASLDPTSPNSFANVLGQSPRGVRNGYNYLWFPQHIAAGLGGTVTFESASASTLLNLSGSFNGGYRPAATPYITSQLIGSEQLELFKFFTLADGDLANKSVKVGIINNILPGQDLGSDYGSFTVVVRDFEDTDQKPNVLETFSNLNLDPASINYIARRIGDRFSSVDEDGLVSSTGDYKNVSKYIRVSVSDAVATSATPTAAKPFGFKAMFQPVSSSYALPAIKLVSNVVGEGATTINNGYNRKVYYGWDFASADNANWNKPIPAGAITSGSGFNLDLAFVHADAVPTSANTIFAAGRSISGSTFTGRDVQDVLKFTVPFQDGFDGMDPAIPKKMGEDIIPSNTGGLDCSTAASPGALAYAKAFNALSNGDEYDINLIVAPGITISDHPQVADKLVELAEGRQDAFSLVDVVKLGETPAQAIAAIANGSIDSTYAATYWPWTSVIDPTRGKPVWVPPSTLMPRVYAHNDTVAAPWFAPAGLNRGGILDAADVERKLGQSLRDELYQAKINPIASFPGQGVVAWGQNTLAALPSALQSINVRRLLIHLKKYIASSSRYLVFDNNTATTRNRFINIVTPYMESVQSRQGIYAFKVVMDETNNSASTIDQKIMYGEIFLQPARAAEFIILDFNVTPTGASFDNV